MKHLSSVHNIAIIKKAVNINMQTADIQNKQQRIVMKWNIEWVDLQIIEHMVAECWRMGGHQLEKYVQKLSNQQELVFAGDLGIRFLELLRTSIDTGKTPDWSKLQKDIHLMQELIQDGQAQHGVYWRSQYQELSANPKAYFGTEFGRAFTEQLGVKLELGISEEQRMLQHDIAKIQKICATCNWDDEKKAKKALQLLTQDEKYYFSSWLGDAFINVLQERYGKKEEEEETELIVQPEVPAVKKSSFRGKIILTLSVCILIGVICLLLILQSDGGRSREKLQKIFSEVRSVIDVAPNQKLQGNQTVQQYMLDTQEGRAANPRGSDRQGDQAAGLNMSDRQGDQAAESNITNRQGDQAVESNMSGTQGSHAASMYGTDTSEDHPEDLSESESDNADAGNTKEAGQDGNFYASDANGQGGDRESADTSGRDSGHRLDGSTAGTGMEEDGRAAANKPGNVELPDILPQYASFHRQYPDLFGWLKIPGTEIDHPVMQSDDEVRGERYFYLHRDYTGKKTEAGSLFVEQTSSCFPQDFNTVIYGHNMSNGHNFGMLEQYKDADFFDKHPMLQYDTIYETGTYQIAAVLITRILYQDEEGFRYYRFYNYDSQEEFQACVDFIQENQLYETGVDLEYGDRLVMLSTCEYSCPNGRLVVVAKKTS